MDKILLSLDCGDQSAWAGLHAINLAKRIQAQISVLLVSNPSRDNEQLPCPKSRIEHLIDQGRREGVPISCYLAEGSFANETVKLVQEKGITLLVVGLPQNGGESALRDFRRTLENIRLKVDCNIEVVQQRNQGGASERDT